MPERLPFFIVGPTGSGKSELAVELAERCDGEIIGADAFQIYRGLDLLTAKPGPALLARAPHHLISELALHESCDVARYLALAEPRIAEIQSRGRRPIVVGGSGLYVRAVTHGLADLPGADTDLRAELAAQPLPELVCRLTALDPIGVRELDLANPRRVIRALEVCLLAGAPFSAFRKQWAQPRFPLHGIFLNPPRDDLYERIDRRTAAMFAAGVIEEVRAVAGISDTAAQALGFSEIRQHMAGALSAAQCLENLQQATRRYAKRQLTWFRREKAFIELNPAAAREWVAAQRRMSDNGLPIFQNPAD